MRRHLILVLTTLALAGCGSAPNCGTIDAQGVVSALHAKEQFRPMLEMVVERTQTAAIAKHREALPDALDAAVERHGQEWERNLVSAWGMLDSSELALVCKAIAERDQETYIRYATRVGQAVQMRNKPLLERAGAEVLAAIY